MIEKRLVDDNSNTTCIITYDIETKQPMDSVNFIYIGKENLSSVKSYSFADGKYDLNELPFMNNYYLKAYNTDSLCKVELHIQHSFLMEDVISNICRIHNSMLPTGQKISALQKISLNSELTEIQYHDINARFTNLPEIFQAFFHSQIINRINLQIKNGYLIKEEYLFTDGSFNRMFYYELGVLVKSIIDVKYKTGISKVVTRTYVLV